jgi:hypothetical protein
MNNKSHALAAGISGINSVLRGITGFLEGTTGVQRRKRRAYEAIVLGYTGIP